MIPHKNESKPLPAMRSEVEYDQALSKAKLLRRLLYIANLACIGATIRMILVLAGSLQAVMD